MAISPEQGSIVLLPFASTDPISVTEQPYLGAAFVVLPGLVLLWPLCLLLSQKAKAPFGPANTK